MRNDAAMHRPKRLHILRKASFQVIPNNLHNLEHQFIEILSHITKFIAGINMHDMEMYVDKMVDRDNWGSFSSKTK